MSVDERIELVDQHREAHGLNRCLEALGVSQGTWHDRMRGGSKPAERRARNEALKPVIIEIIRKNPAYGYRRIKPDLKDLADEVVNHKRLRRLLNDWELSFHRTASRPKPGPIRRVLSKAKGRLNLIRDRDPTALEGLSTEFTELRYRGGDRKAAHRLHRCRERLDARLGRGALGQP